MADWRTGLAQLALRAKHYPKANKLQEAEDLAVAEGLLSGAIPHDPGTPHEFGSTHFLLPSELAASVLSLASRIPDSMLADSGRVQEAHLTILHGTTDDNPEPVLAVIKGVSPVTIQIGAISCFYAAHTGNDYDVVKLEVESPALHKLHKRLALRVDNEQTFSTYTPHITLGYVRPGYGKLCKGASGLEGKDFLLKDFVFSDRKRNQVVVDLSVRQPVFGVGNTVKAMDGLTEKGSFFSECDRDDKGHCKKGTGGGEGNKENPKQGKDDRGRIVIGQTKYASLPHNERMAIADALADWTGRDSDELARSIKKMDVPLPIVKAEVGPLMEQVKYTHVPEESKVSGFKKTLQDPSFDMDPVFVRGERFFDGGHRVKAYAEAGRSHIPAVDVEPLWEKIAYNHVESDTSKSSLTARNDGLEAMRDVLSSLPTEDLDGLYVWVNPDVNKCIIDALDWHNGDGAKAVGRAAEISMGPDNVTYQNEGPRPEGSGWVELAADILEARKPEATEKSAGAPVQSSVVQSTGGALRGYPGQGHLAPLKRNKKDWKSAFAELLQRRKPPKRDPIGVDHLTHKSGVDNTPTEEATPHDAALLYLLEAERDDDGNLVDPDEVLAAVRAILTDSEGKPVGWTQRSLENLTQKASFFATCERDKKGHCLPGTGGPSPSTESKPSREKPAPASKPAANPSPKGYALTRDARGRKTYTLDGKRVSASSIPSGAKIAGSERELSAAKLVEQINSGRHRDPESLTNALQSLTVKEIHEVKKALGLSGSGRKEAFARKIAERALAGRADQGLVTAPGKWPAGQDPAKVARGFGLPEDFYKDDRSTTGNVVVNPKYDPDGAVSLAANERRKASVDGTLTGNNRQSYDDAVRESLAAAVALAKADTVVPEAKKPVKEPAKPAEVVPEVKTPKEPETPKTTVPEVKISPAATAAGVPQVKMPANIDSLLKQSAAPASEADSGPEKGLIDKSAAQKLGRFFEDADNGKLMPLEEAAMMATDQAARAKFPDDASHKAVNDRMAKVLAKYGQNEVDDLAADGSLPFRNAVYGEERGGTYPAHLDKTAPAYAAFLRDRVGAKPANGSSSAAGVPQAKASDPGPLRQKLMNMGASPTDLRDLDTIASSHGVGVEQTFRLGSAITSDEARSNAGFREYQKAASWLKGNIRDIDLPQAQRVFRRAGIPLPAKPAAAKESHHDKIVNTVDRLTKEHHGLVPLDVLQKETGLSLSELHDAVQDLRRQGVLTGTPHESRGGLPSSLAAAGIPAPYGGTPIHYLSRRQKSLGSPLGRSLHRAWVTQKGSFFHDCTRDKQGHCQKGTGNSGSQAKKKAKRLAAMTPAKREQETQRRGIVSGILKASGDSIAKGKLLARKILAVAGRKLSPAARKRVRKTCALAKAVEHKVMIGFTKARELAVEAAKQRGVSDLTADRAGKILATADLAAAWLVNMPAAHHAAGPLGEVASLAIGKAASWIPVASLGYIAFSTARNPLATWRAARKVLSGATAGESHKSLEDLTEKGSFFAECERDEQGHCLPGTGGKKDKKDDEAEWDGTIEQDEVSPDRSRSYVTSWNFHDGDYNYEQNIYIREGTYDPNTDNPDRDPVTVYRWESRDDSGSGEEGEWVTDRDEAEAAGKEFAKKNNQDPPEPPPPVQKKVRLGKSAAGVKVSVADKAKADALVQKLFPAGSVEESYKAISSVVGTPDDGEVVVVSAGKYDTLYSDDIPMQAEGIRIQIKHPKLSSCSRFIGVDSNGKKFVKNEIIEVKPEYQKEGLGLSIFAKQVENAGEAGFDYIGTHAAGGPGESMNGYYTWPRFGYNQGIARLKQTNPSIADKVQQEYPQAKSIRDVMSSPEGRDWWKENGGDLHDARFDLRENSWSQYIMNEYLAERAAKKGK